MIEAIEHALTRAAPRAAPAMIRLHARIIADRAKRKMHRGRAPTRASLLRWAADYHRAVGRLDRPRMRALAARVADHVPDPQRGELLGLEPWLLALLHDLAAALARDPGDRRAALGARALCRELLAASRPERVPRGGGRAPDPRAHAVMFAATRAWLDLVGRGWTGEAFNVYLGEIGRVTGAYPRSGFSGIAREVRREIDAK